MKNLFKNNLIVVVIAALIFGAGGYFLAHRGNLAVYQKGFQDGIQHVYSPLPTTKCAYDSNLISEVGSAAAKQRIENYGTWVGLEYAYLKKAAETNDLKALKTYILDSMPSTNFKYLIGWTIPVDELIKEVKKDSSIHFVRAYISMDQTPPYGGWWVHGMLNTHLILTPVDSSYKYCGGRDKKLAKYYNLVRPCPQMCDESSELYLSYEKGFESGKKGCLGLPDSVYHHNP